MSDTHPIGVFFGIKVPTAITEDVVKQWVSGRTTSPGRGVTVTSTGGTQFVGMWVGIVNSDLPTVPDLDAQIVVSRIPTTEPYRTRLMWIVLEWWAFQDWCQTHHKVLLDYPDMWAMAASQ